jgi:hypothetical protein
MLDGCSTFAGVALQDANIVTSVLSVHRYSREKYCCVCIRTLNASCLRTLEVYLYRCSVYLMSASV